MKNSNIIISVIIVLCIAAGVSAYNITNPESNILSLPGFTPSDDGDANDVNTGDGTGLNNGTGDTDTGNTGVSGSSSGSSNSGSSGTGGGSNAPNHNGMTASQAKQIISSAIGEPGAYAGTPKWDSSIKMWVAKIYDKNGTVVDSIGVDADGRTNRV